MEQPQEMSHYNGHNLQQMHLTPSVVQEVLSKRINYEEQTMRKYTIRMIIL